MVRSELNMADGPKMIRAVPSARWMAQKERINLSCVKGSGPEGILLPKDIEKFKRSQTVIPSTSPSEKRWASSLARRLAEKKGIPLKGIKGSGARGRILMGDVLKALEERPSPSDERGGFGRTFPMSQMRKVIARRMSQSAFTAPHSYFFADVEMDALGRLRDEMLPDFEREFKIRISLNDFFIKAVALAITEFPILNAQIKGEEIYIMPDINIGIAVALPEGLVVPAVPHADKLSLAEIAKIRTDLVERARAGTLRLEEMERGTFTISSLAQFDITFFTAILNPPQSGILSIGRTLDQLALKDEKVILKRVARLGLSVDHRMIDGIMAARFLQSLKTRLEQTTFASL